MVVPGPEGGLSGGYSTGGGDLAPLGSPFHHASVWVTQDEIQSVVIRTGNL